MRDALGNTTANTDAYDPQHIRAAAAGIRRAAANATVPFFVLLPPRTVEVAESAFRYPSQLGDELHTTAVKVALQNVSA